MANNKHNPEDLPPKHFSEEDFIPDSIYEDSNTDSLRNSKEAVAPARIIDAEAFASVEPTLMYQILDYIEDLIYPLAFPIDTPYVADFIILAREHNVEDFKTIGEQIILTLLNENILSEDFGPFDQKDLKMEANISLIEKEILERDFGPVYKDDRVGIQIFTAIHLANGLLDYTRYAKKMENGKDKNYDREIRLVNNHIRDLLSIVYWDSIDETPGRLDLISPGNQKVMIPRAGLFASIRVLESAVRMFEASIWKTDLFWTASFREQADHLRRQIKSWDEDQSQE